MNFKFLKLSLTALLLSPISAYAIGEGTITVTESSICEDNQLTKCRRYIACPRDFRILKQGNKVSCKLPKGAQKMRKPSCSKYNGYDSWYWSDEQDGCVRKRLRGGITAPTTKNMSCPAHMVYKRLPNGSKKVGRCVTALYAKAELVTSPNIKARLQPMEGSTAAIQKLSCESGGKLMFNKNAGNSYNCRYITQDREAVRQCRKKNGVFNYSWNGTTCVRGGKKDSSLSYCPSGYKKVNTVSGCLQKGRRYWIPARLY